MPTDKMMEVMFKGKRCCKDVKFYSSKAQTLKHYPQLQILQEIVYTTLTFKQREKKGYDNTRAQLEVKCLQGHHNILSNNLMLSKNAFIHFSSIIHFAKLASFTNVKSCIAKKQQIYSLIDNATKSKHHKIHERNGTIFANKLNIELFVGFNVTTVTDFVLGQEPELQAPLHSVKPCMGFLLTQ
ncbi:hypothetical protein FF38_09663 [Lucilia cuprina]|uniref:Uncharacterized protein n=1 Tax=Lucilia cuprina TaxID=7375 RepID=A0A0L0CR05_LUCCU|nr:hypothetical protein FF38_09663 [Lucilia cuprina]